MSLIDAHKVTVTLNDIMIAFLESNQEIIQLGGGFKGYGFKVGDYYALCQDRESEGTELPDSLIGLWFSLYPTEERLQEELLAYTL